MADSKPVAGKPDDEMDDATRARQVFMVNFHFVVNLCSSLLTWQARSQLLLKFVNGDAKQMASWLARWTLVCGFGEFLLNPTVGKLSDAYGRKPVMILSPIMNLVMKSLVIVNPSLLTISLEKIFCDGLRTISGTTMMKCALMDSIKDRRELGTAFGWITTYVGLVVLVMPQLAGRLSQGGKHTAPYKAALAVSAMHLAGLLFAMKETNQTKIPFDGGFVNPFDCYKLFTQGKALATTTAQQMCQWFVEPKNLADMNIVVGMNDMGWDDATMNRYTSTAGFGLFLAGPISKYSLKSLGGNMHTKVTQILSAVLYAGKGMFATSTAFQFGSIAPFIFANTRDVQTSVDAVELAKAANMGKGELSGYQANLRAVMAAIAPYVFSLLYNTGGPSPPYMAAAVAMCLSHVLHARATGYAKEGKEAK